MQSKHWKELIVAAGLPVWLSVAVRPASAAHISYFRFETLMQVGQCQKNNTKYVMVESKWQFSTGKRHNACADWLISSRSA